MHIGNSFKKQLNPFSFPPETNVRFWLLILAVIMLAVSISQPLHIMTRLVINLSQGLPFSEAIEPPVFNVPDEEDSFRSQALSGVSERVPSLAFTAGIIFIIFILAIAIYRTHPSRIRRRKRLTPLDSDRHPKLNNRVEEIASQVDISPPTVMVGEGLRSQNGQAYGLGKNFILGLGGGVRLLLVKAPARFRALILHEFAHIANQDIRLAYFSEALWRAILLIVVIPFFIILFGWFIVSAIGAILSGNLSGLVLAIFQSILGFIVNFIVFALPLLVIVIILAGLLRVREFYADWRAAQWSAEGPLLDILDASAKMEISNRKFRLRFHPPARARLKVLRDPTELFRLRLDLPFVTGILLAMVITGLNTHYFAVSGTILGVLMAWVSGLVEMALTSESIRFVQFVNLVWSAISLVTPILTVILILGIGYLIAGTVGLQIQKESVAAKASKDYGYDWIARLAKAALLMTVGLEIGFLITPPYTFSPLGAVIGGLINSLSLFLILPWFIGFFLFTCLGFLYTRYTALAITSSHIGKSPPKWRLRATMLVQIIAFFALYFPLLVGRLLILYPRDQLFFTIFLTSMCLGPILHVVIFGATWLVVQLVRPFQLARCPHCGKITQQKGAVGRNCEHCGQELAPWLFIESS